MIFLIFNHDSFYTNVSQNFGSETFGMQTISVVQNLNKGDTIFVNKYKSGSLLKNSHSKKSNQFMGWLIKTPQPSMIFDGFSDRSQSTGTITYSGTNANFGNGLNTSGGSFVAPVSGIYYFHFQGLTDDGNPNLINVKVNGKIVASTFRNKRMVKLKTSDNLLLSTKFNFFS